MTHEDCKPSFGDANRMPEFDDKAELQKLEATALKPTLPHHARSISLRNISRCVFFLLPAPSASEKLSRIIALPPLPDSTPHGNWPSVMSNHEL